MKYIYNTSMKDMEFIEWGQFFAHYYLRLPAPYTIQYAALLTTTLNKSTPPTCIHDCANLIAHVFIFSTPISYNWLCDWSSCPVPSSFEDVTVPWISSPDLCYACRTDAYTWMQVLNIRHLNLALDSWSSENNCFKVSQTFFF